MGDIKRQPTRKRPTAGRLDLTEAREEWLVTGDSMLDWYKFEELFESMDHARELWKIHREKLLKREFRHECFGIKAHVQYPEKKLWGEENFEPTK
jgi:hypothetical protein